MEKALGIIATILWLVVCTAFYMLTESIILGILLGIVVAVIVVVLFWLYCSGETDLKEKNKKSGLIKMSISIISGIAVVILLIWAIISGFRGSSSNSSHKCNSCGKNEGNYSNGYCHSCYKKVEQTVKDDYYNYGK